MRIPTVTCEERPERGNAGRADADGHELTGTPGDHAGAGRGAVELRCVKQDDIGVRVEVWFDGEAACYELQMFDAEGPVGPRLRVLFEALPPAPP